MEFSSKALYDNKLIAAESVRFRLLKDIEGIPETGLFILCQ